MRRTFFTPLLSLFVLVTLGISTITYAATPTLALSTLSNGSVQLRITADSHSEITLHYIDSYNDAESVDIGTTDGEGYLTTALSRSDYSIPAGALVHIQEGSGALSSDLRWPAANNAISDFTLAQDAPTLAAGQTVVIPVDGLAGNTLSVSSNSNPSVATITTNGSQVSVTALAAGTDVVSICISSTNSHCQTLSITVAGSTTTGDFYFSNGNPVISVGTTTLVVMGGRTGSFYISKNTNPSAVQGNLQNNLLTLYGNAAGTSNITVCLPGASCSVIQVTVISGSNRTPTPILSSTNTSLTVGQGSMVSVAGTSIYHVEKNNHTDVVQATLSGSSLTLVGKAVGSATLTICDSTSVYCGYVTVQVSPAPPPVVVVPTTPVTTPTSNFSFTSALAQGSTGIEVTALQKVLAVLGYFTGDATGTYGPQTAAAVKKFQAAHSLTQLGSVGPGTRAALNAVLASGTSTLITTTSIKSDGYVFTEFMEIGSTGAEVHALQTRLATLGFYSGPVTGTFGAQTAAAVVKFQKAHALTQAGYVGPGTRAALNAS